MRAWTAHTPAMNRNPARFGWLPAILVGCSGLQTAPSPPPLPPACRTGCASPFGAPLGVNQGVKAYSNCASACVVQRPVTLSAASTGRDEPTFTGIAWQCVEYARRWWALRRGVVFDSVEAAADMWTEVRSARRLSDGAEVPVRALPNGGSEPPAVGDLVIYPRDPAAPHLRYGHVAVVVAVGAEPGEGVQVAEQNFANLSWEGDHARTLRLDRVGGRYTLRDPAQGPAERSPIAGWLRLTRPSFRQLNRAASRAAVR